MPEFLRIDFRLGSSAVNRPVQSRHKHPNEPPLNLIQRVRRAAEHVRFAPTDAMF
jgi:hypothetical protein